MVDVLLYVIAGFSLLLAAMAVHAVVSDGRQSVPSNIIESARSRQVARHQGIALYLIAAILALGFASNG